MKLNPTMRVVFVLTLIGVVMSSSCKSRLARLDEQASDETKVCDRGLAQGSLSPPPGDYRDQGIALDYDRLAPLPNPRENVDQEYTRRVYVTPARLEQVYADATDGNLRASWLVCVAEAGIRSAGRTAARELASLKCQTLYNCSYKFEKLPFSADTASGRRVLTELGIQFRSEATELQIAQGVITDGLSVFVGIRVATKLPRLPPDPLATPAPGAAGKPTARSASSTSGRPAPKKTFTNKFPEHTIDAPLQEFAIEQVTRRTFNRTLNYAVMEDGSLRLGRRVQNRPGGGHIDLTNGKPVLAAGEVHFAKGEVRWVDNASGHYLPSGPSAQQAAEEAFRRAGIDITDKYMEKVWRNGAWVVKDP